MLFSGQRLAVPRPFGSYVMENVLFKVSFPAEFHAQTAVEAAVRLHPQVAGRLDEIERIVIETQESGVRIIDKTGPLANPADRDHCMQYMVAVPLIHGTLTAEHYEDEAAADPRIDALRQTMQVVENRRYSVDYLDPEKRSIANAVQVFFRDGTQHRAGRGRIPARPPPPAGRGAAAAAAEVRVGPGEPVPAGAGGGGRTAIQRLRRRGPARRPRRHAGRAVHGNAGVVSGATPS